MNCNNLIASPQQLAAVTPANPNVYIGIHTIQLYKCTHVPHEARLHVHMKSFRNTHTRTLQQVPRLIYLLLQVHIQNVLT